MSKKFQKNDRIVKIDDTQINEHGDGLTKALLGPDIPGSKPSVAFELSFHGIERCCEIAESIDIVPASYLVRVAGTMVTIVVRRGSQTLPPITLIRACTTELADKR